MKLEQIQKYRWAKQGGLTLLEVLVALMVLSIGLMGLAGLQGTSLRMNNSAYMRSQATALAYDMADRVRANVDAGTAYNQPSAPGSSGSPMASCEEAAGCEASDMAANDIFRWREQISQLLPQGVGVICLDSTPASVDCDGGGDTYVIRVTWDDNRLDGAEADDPNENVVLSFRP